jgi:hypothetical protein
VVVAMQAYWFVDFYTLDWGREKIEEFLDTCQVRRCGRVQELGSLLLLALLIIKHVVINYPHVMGFYGCP